MSMLEPHTGGSLVDHGGACSPPAEMTVSADENFRRARIVGKILSYERRRAGFAECGFLEAKMPVQQILGYAQKLTGEAMDRGAKKSV